MHRCKYLLMTQIVANRSFDVNKAFSIMQAIKKKRKIPRDDWSLQIHNVNENRGQEVGVTFSLSRNLKKRQKDRKMSLVKEEAKEDSEEAVGLIKKVGFQDHHQ